VLRLVVDPEHPEPRKIARAVEALRHGELLAYPTDTVYALGCDYEDRKAVERLYALKGMKRDQPLAFLLPDLGEIARFGVVSNGAYRLMKRLIPGPYTFVLEATREVPRPLIVDRKHGRDTRRTVGVRVPDHPVTQALLAAAGRPLLSTSCAGDDGEPLGDPNEVRDRYERGLDLLVDGGYTGTQVSTVLSLIRDQLDVLREGKGPVEDLPR
jgi:tRNA threonylcarbamoyl adenosine modification protein (Sua5/YciO/YrdC/YwlC family)